MTEERNTPIKILAVCLITIFAVVALFVVNILPQIKRGRDVSHVIECMSNMRTTGVIVQIYATDNDDFIMSDISLLEKPEYCGLPEGTVCAGNRNDFYSGRDYILCAAGKVADFPDPGNNLMLYELPKNHFQTSVNCRFVDAHVENIEARNFKDFVRDIQDANNLLAKLRNNSETK